MPKAGGLRKPTNLSLDKALSSETEAKSELWKKENAAALESSNQWVEAHGLPLVHFHENPPRRP